MSNTRSGKVRTSTFIVLLTVLAFLPVFVADALGSGGSKEVRVSADYDGDGKTDAAIWRPETGVWTIRRSSDKKSESIRWGQDGDIPVQADYDGDGRADLAVFRPAQNDWHILESKTGAAYVKNFGIAGVDILVPADYTRDGKADLAVYRRDTWIVVNSETNEIEPFYFGYADATPVPADYDGDGEVDFAFVRKGVWYVYESFEPRLRTYRFGSRAARSPIAKRSTVGS